MPKFCHNCGKEAQPTWKACPHCETSFSSLTNRPASNTYSPPPQQQANPFQRAYSDDDGDGYIDKANSLAEILRGKQVGALAVEIVKEQSVKETIGSVASQGSNIKEAEVISRPAPYANIDGEAFLKEFQKEAGTRGPSNPNS